MFMELELGYLTVIWVDFGFTESMTVLNANLRNFAASIFLGES